MKRNNLTERILFLLAVGALMLALSACADKEQRKPDTSVSDTTQTQNMIDNNEDKEKTVKEQKLLGGLKPEDALEYLKKTPDAVIVQVNTAEWKIEPGFKGALWIPHDEIAQRCDEIPSGRPVILHCGAGVVSVPAYETLIEKRPDIPELGYIAGRPHEIMKEYNEWLIEEASSDPSLTIAETEQTNSMSAKLVQTPPQGVRLTFHYTKAATKASNQFAVWIEDSEGNIVKTIAVTDFTAQGGYDKREDALPKWVKAADPAKSAAEQIDAVSSATPAIGNL